MSDPVIWFAGNAILDGLEPGSDDVRERLLYSVYQRRLVLEALKTKATLLALCENLTAAAKTAQEYMEMAIPISEEEKVARVHKLDDQLRELENMPVLSARRSAGL